MALISMRQLLDHAAEHGYGVPVEQVQEGIRHGVRKVNSLEVMQAAYDAGELTPRVN